MECKISIRNIGIEEVPIAQEFLFKMIRKLFKDLIFQDQNMRNCLRVFLLDL